MKRITFLLLFVASSFLYTSCSDDEKQEPLITFTGVLNLIKIEANIPNINYDKGQITWTVNTDKKTITIKNTVDNYVGVLAIFANNHSGTYSYTIEKENNFEYLIVEGKKGVMNYTNEGLEIDYGLAVDDVRYTFKR